MSTSIRQVTMTWKEDARKLAFGQKVKVQHCGPDKTAYINNTEKGVSLHCFRCKENEFEPHGKLSAVDYLRMRDADREAARKPIPDTKPLTKAPDSGKLFVLKAGITPERASDKYGFGWSDKINRVVIPVLHDFKPTGQWLARATDGRKPKYIFGEGSNAAHWVAKRRGKAVVVVEDVLSAIKVYEAGYSALAVCGTNVSQSAAMCMVGHDVVGWFDGDKAGDGGYVRLRKALSPFGIDPRKVRSDRDPKLYNKNDIRRYINENTK